MNLNVTLAADGPGTPVILTHGLFGQGRNLGVIARRLAGRRVLMVDLRNHGDSPWSDTHDYPTLARDLSDVIEAEGGQADVVGHSMGGKAAMALALNHPEMLRRLVVLDIAPIAYTHSQIHYANAMRDLDLTDLRSRSEADRRFAELVWEPGVRAFLLQSLDLRADPPRWKMNLEVLARQMPVLTGWPEGMPAGTFAGPVLALYGSKSDYVEPPGQAALRAAFPQVELRRMEGVGHWLHAERPDEVAGIVADFLA